MGFPRPKRTGNKSKTRPILTNFKLFSSEFEPLLTVMLIVHPDDRFCLFDEIKFVCQFHGCFQIFEAYSTHAETFAISCQP